MTSPTLIVTDILYDSYHTVISTTEQPAAPVVRDHLGPRGLVIVNIHKVDLLLPLCYHRKHYLLGRQEKKKALLVI